MVQIIQSVKFAFVSVPRRKQAVPTRLGRSELFCPHRLRAHWCSYKQLPVGVAVRPPPSGLRLKTARKSVVTSLFVCFQDGAGLSPLLSPSRRDLNNLLGGQHKLSTMEDLFTIRP